MEVFFMKTIYRISLFLNLCMACFLLVKGTEYYYINFVSMPDVKEEFRQTKAGTDLEEADLEEADLEKENLAGTDLAVAVLDEPVTTCDTTYIVREHDYTTMETSSHEEEMPDMYIGKTREQLEDIFDSYTLNPSLEDQERGFEGMKLNSFSSDMVIAVRYYRSPSTEEDFYLMVEDDYITVYLGDLKTVYLYTDIYMNDLPDALRQEILDRKHVADKEELYNFLESYSS